MNLVKAKKSNCDFLAHFQKKPLCLKASKFAIISYNIQLSTTSELYIPKPHSDGLYIGHNAVVEYNKGTRPICIVGAFCCRIAIQTVQRIQQIGMGIEQRFDTW